MIDIQSLSSLDEESREEVIDRLKTEFKDIEASVRRILDDVRDRQEEAISEYVRSFDKADLKSFRVSEEEIATALKRTPRALVSAMSRAADNICRFQKRQLPTEFRSRSRNGLLGQLVVPIARVGVYAPGGTAIYPSSALMGCIPARVAGVPEVVLCTPPRADGTVSDAMLVAANLAGATEIYKIGGVQAIAAMAYGTGELQPVDKIVGPGNKYVTVAKQLVRQECDIEFLAGPSEILVIADDSAQPEFVAYDMLAQLEHDPDAKAVLVALSEELAKAVVAEIERLWKELPRAEILGQALMRGCTVLVTDSLEEAVDFANDYAPEHLSLVVREAESILKSICNAGSIFLGNWSSVSLGDYCAGPNHILPTMGLAWQRGALSPMDFIKVIPYQRTSRAGAQKLSSIAAAIARAEGLEAHARAAEARRETSSRD